MVWFCMGLGELWGVQWYHLVKQGVWYCNGVWACGLWVWGMWPVVRRHLGVVWSGDYMVSVY